MRDLQTAPAWTAEDLGLPLPDTRHACSVCLPTWDSIVGYEEGRDKVMRKLRSGYPRFCIHPAVERVFAEATTALASPGQKAVLFPRKEAAQRAQRYVEKRTSEATSIVSYEGMHALLVSEENLKLAMEYWRFTGEIISSRQAVNVLEGKDAQPDEPQVIRHQMARLGGYQAEDVYLYENGMAAIYAVYRTISASQPSKKTLQIEFPYVDVLKVQQHFGQGVVFLNEAVGESLDEALQRMTLGEFAAVFCEMPSNPLLRTVDLAKISAACREGGIPLIVDDTVASAYNIDVTSYADVITTSLTKWVSGKGDVMAGQVTLVPESPFYSELREFFEIDCPSGVRLYGDDASVLSFNAEGFSERMAKVNTAGELVADFLQEHAAIDSVMFPKFTTAAEYEKLMREGGGFGGLISFTLKQAKKTAKFYDALQLTKGPSLGTDFTLVCPFTMLAHYDELDWAEGCGVSRNLIRISVGCEDANWIIEKLEQALDAVS
ncbi:PLP-dependent transferase [Persicirhabdus sediminis]|uniref:PLP-dependent transferase n=1 Tax=Persicirhabdus sediminis TaxID=454144 RepID=A0A8J7MDB6_9BACT|nr:PLP-dependent transferase [Persicirhabdus sediminis]MBK1790408.1 PLP-dependent transferase [Persicirhabdus sediminis]